ncbi:right-handed parallel beta-helix repeat-containing protein [Candidatus Woesearchaeota archaeon]|nr:right-handed parallel beta-helix repeat-containing protein [Candidatus Woesearchaeota archaeon]
MDFKKILLILFIFCILSAFSAYAINFKGIAWNATYDDGNVDTAYGVDVDSAGNPVVTGKGNNDYVTFKYASKNGAQIWNATYAPGVTARGIHVDALNNVAVTGDSPGGILTVKYNSAGVRLWNDTYNPGGFPTGRGVASDSQNNIIITGSGTANTDFVTVKYNSTGSQLWIETYGFSNSLDYGKGVVDSQNNIVVTGRSNASGDWDILTVKYNSTGGQLWNTTFDTGNPDDVEAIALDSNDNIIVAGYETVALQREDYLIVKFNSTGGQIWNVTIDNDERDIGHGVAVTPSDNIVVTGYSGPAFPLRYNYFTVMLNQSGAMIWNGTYDNGNDFATAVASDSQGNVIITGYSDNVTASKTDSYFTLKYLFNDPPTQDNPILNSSVGGNTVIENLTVYPQNVVDPEGSHVTNITNWFMNGTSITVLNMPFDTNITSNATGAVRDYSPFQNNGTVNGSVWTAAGISGGAYIYDGIDDGISVPAANSLNLSENFSVEVWIKPRKLGGIGSQYILDKGDASGVGVNPGHNYALFINSFTNRTIFIIHGTGAFPPGAAYAVGTVTTLKPDQWYHIVGTFVNSTHDMRIYLNGSFEANQTSNWPGGPPLYSYPLTIGRQSLGNFNLFNGTIDEVRVYNRALTPAQIKANYNKGHPNYNTIVSQETRVNETWRACLTPNDAIDDGQTKCSNNVTIKKQVECGDYIANDTVLLRDLRGNGTCFTIIADHVTLDCAGHMLIGNGTGQGIVANHTNNITIKNCVVRNFTNGIYLNHSNDSLVQENTAYNHSNAGFYLISSSRNDVINNTAYNSTYGILLNLSSNNTLTGNLVYNSQDFGFYLQDNSCYNYLFNNTARNTSDTGFHLALNSSYNTIRNNSAHATQNRGFHVDNCTGNILASNNAYDNVRNGFDIHTGSSSNSLFNNTAYNNGFFGFLIYQTDNNTLKDNAAYDNTRQGVVIRIANNTNISNMHVYNNALGEVWIGTGATPCQVYISGLIIDRPADGFQYYTNLSITDSVDPNTEYIIYWASQGTLPANYISFRRKFVNISNFIGATTIDSITWRWLDSELAGYNESQFELWQYNASGWTMLNNSPDTAANTLGLRNLAPSSDYGILQQAPPAPPGPSGGGGGGGGRSYINAMEQQERQAETQTTTTPVAPFSYLPEFEEEEIIEEEPAVPVIEEKIEIKEEKVPETTVIAPETPGFSLSELISTRNFVRAALLILVVSILVYIFALSRFLKKKQASKEDVLVEEMLETPKKPVSKKIKPKVSAPKVSVLDKHEKTAEDILKELNKYK